MTEDQKTETRKNWRHRWLGELFLFSHVEYQKALWVDYQFPNEASWFPEDINKYFDDLYLDDHYATHIQEGYITTEEFLSIKDFHARLDAFVTQTDPFSADFNITKMLEDNEWVAICSVGRSSWNALKSIISNPEELEHMNGLERNYL